MRHDKLEKQLYLLQLLTENRSYTLDKLCDKLDLSLRNLYYYLDFFRDSGFHLYKHGDYYCIDRDSPFFTRLFDRITFTEEEAITMRRLLDKVDKQSAIVQHLKNKLDKFYDFHILDSSAELDEHNARIVGLIYDAIKYRRQLLLRNYSSPHSNSRRDRLVEPFLLMNGNHEVRCFETTSRMNKTFKISRMEDVELLDTHWMYESSHRQLFTDVFMFSGEVRYPIVLCLGHLSYNVLIEEYPNTAKYIQQTNDGKYLLEMDVCSYLGIGRFVLGLFDDIEVIGDEGFKAYLKEKIQLYLQHI